MQSVLIVIHILIVVALVAVVLLQRSEGGVLGIGRRLGQLHDRPGPGERAVARHSDPRNAVLRHLDPDVDHRRMEPDAAFDPEGPAAPASQQAAGRSVRPTSSTS